MWALNFILSSGIDQSYADVMEDAHKCSHIPEHLLKFINKFEEEENDGNPFANSPEIVPSISVAARIVQIRSSSNE